MSIKLASLFKKCLQPGISAVVGITLALTSALPAQAAAAPPVDLVIGGEGGTVWNFANIKPGDRGTKVISLRNVGDTDGRVTIWLSRIVNTRNPGVDPKYANLPGELPDYLKINAASRGLEANLALPVLLKNFPQTSSGQYYVRINPVRAGETVSLTWVWELPVQTGNDVQGKGTSFTIYYLLEQLPSSPPLPAGSEPEIPLPPVSPLKPPENLPAPPAVQTPVDPPPGGTPAAPPTIPRPSPVIPPETPLPAPAAPEPVPPDAPGSGVPDVTPPVAPLNVLMVNSQVAVKIDANGVMQEPARLSDKSAAFVINIDKGTRITDQDGKVLDSCVLAVVPQKLSDLAAVPPGVVAVGSVYTIEGFSRGKQVAHVIFEPYVTVSLTYDPEMLPDNVLPPFMVNFDDGGNPVRLNPPPGTIFETGTVKAAVYHASYFALMAEVLPPPAPLPPRFNVSNLKISPALAMPGQTVIISIDIANDGAAGGIYELHLIVDGMVRAIKEVDLEANTIATLTFELSDLKAGSHQIRIAGFSGGFRIIGDSVSVPGTTINWPVIDLIVGISLFAAVLLTVLFIRRMNPGRAK